MTDYKEGDLLKDPTTNQPLKLFGLEKTEMVFVEKGSFIMGEGENTTEINFKEGYFIGKYPVTQELYEKVMGKNPSHFKGKYRPVEMVSWFDICEGKDSFLTKLSDTAQKNIQILKGKFNLPSEAQWEYAARGGKRWNNPKLQFSGSQIIKDVAWFEANSNKNTLPVGLKQPNSLGIYDMSGNVWEWCDVIYSEKNKISQNNINYFSREEDRILCGGSFFNFAELCRVTERSSSNYKFQFNKFGFRIVISISSL